MVNFEEHQGITREFIINKLNGIFQTEGVKVEFEKVGEKKTREADDEYPFDVFEDTFKCQLCAKELKVEKHMGIGSGFTHDGSWEPADEVSEHRVWHKGQKLLQELKEKLK